MSTLVKLGKSFQVTGLGLEIRGEPAFEECETFGAVLPVLESALPFALGDYVNYIRGRFGEKASQILDGSNGWKESTMDVYAWVCAHVAVGTRRAGLSFKHHMVVAALSVEDQGKWLKAAEQGDGDGKAWSSNRLRQALVAGQDPPVSGWYLFVNCGSAKVRKEIARMIAGVALEVKEVDRRRVDATATPVPKRVKAPKAKKGAAKK